MKIYERNKNRGKRKKVFALCSCMIMAVGMVSGCGKNQDNTKESDRYIAVICKGSQHEFWKTVEQGAMDAGEELGIKVTFEAPEDESQIDVQIEMVERAIENDADAIVLAPLDTDKLNDVIEKAENEGIPVLTLDSDVTTNARIATIGTDNESAGAIAARNAVELIGESGKIAIVGHVEGAQTATERVGGFVDEIESGYKDSIQIVEIMYCNGDSDIAREQTLNILDDYPDIDCIYGTNEGAVVGIASAIEERGLKNRVNVIGFDSSDSEIEYLQNGVIDGMIVQNPYNMGYLGVRNINKVLDGLSIDEKFDTGATYVSPDNINDEDTQWLLYPLGKTEE